MFVNTFFEERLQNLLDLAARVDELFRTAGVDYRVVGGLATYLYVEAASPDAGRLTRDIDVAIHRRDLDRISATAPQFGLEFRHVAGVDMLVQTEAPSAKRAVHLIMAGEKVRPEYPETAPPLGEPQFVKGIRLMPLSDLVRMKLTSYRTKDETHIIDLDEAGLITPDIEASLSPVLLARLNDARERQR
jgi:hypothetical protein